MANNGQNRRPKPIIQSMVLHNSKDEEQQWWEPHVFQEGAWVYMQPSAIGPHRVRERANVDLHWKGRLIGFKQVRDKGTVAIVQHVFMFGHMRLQGMTNPRDFPCNCMSLAPQWFWW